MALGVFLFLFGLIILVVSSDWLIHSSVRLSFLYKLTPLFVGLVVIAFGTSAPEAGVGIVAALKDHKNIALGNILGSNIANIGLILGLCAFIFPLKIRNKEIFKREMPIMIFSVLLLYGLCMDLVISRLDGVILLICFIIFCSVSYFGAKKYFDATEAQNFKFKKLLAQTNSRFFTFTCVILSLAGVILGADLMVRGGVSLAKILGISTWVIGIVVFAVGTSLPELVASLTASLRKVPSISVGNIVGSNIFNVLFVLGVVALIRPIALDASILRFELPVVIGFSFLLFTVMRTRYTITRWEGLVMFLGYIVFIFFVLRR